MDVKFPLEHQENSSLQILPYSVRSTVLPDVHIVERNYELITPGTLNIVSDIRPYVVTSLVNLFNPYPHRFTSAFMKFGVIIF